jgi:CRISPR system Cascade subunit CasE
VYLSRLILNAKHPRTRSEVEHPYELHRTICRAFENPTEARILFRADTDRPGKVHVLVQSLMPPNWDRLDLESNYAIERGEAKPLELNGLMTGQPLRFRLRCRPSKRIGDPTSPDRGKRRTLTERDEIIDWLMRKARENGFEVRDVAFDRLYWKDSKSGKSDQTLGCVQFDGVLTVTDPDKVKQAVRNGIGPQKAYGFGLLSLARCE